MALLNPRVDIAFKILFGSEDNKDLLISFINSVVSDEDQVASVEILSPYTSRIPRVLQKLADFEAGASKFDQAKPIVEEGPVLHRPDKARSKGLAEGLAEGLAKGEAKAKIEMAKTLTLQGVALSVIQAATGLSEGELHQILKS